MKRLAAIDVGSNSVLLQIVETRDREIVRTISAMEQTPRISEGLKKSGRISGAAMERLISALMEFKRECEKHNVSEISCYGTSAMREALNSGDVAASVKEETDIEIEVISGEREAALTYLGASIGMEGLNDDRVLIDAGGGSSEIVVANKSVIRSAESFKIGAVRLTEEFGTDEQQSESETAEVKREIERELSQFGLPGFIGKPSIIVSGGTPTALAAFRLGLRRYEPDRVHGMDIAISEYAGLITELAAMNPEERRNALAFEPKRADVITAGGLLSLCLAEHYGAGSVRVSERSLRYGQLYELLGFEIEFA